MDIKNYLPVSADHFVIMSVSLMAVVIFCYLTGISLIIPFLFFFFGVHLFLHRGVPTRTFIHLLFLLALLLFGAHLLKSYGMLTNFYLPVSVVPMLTILLFGQLQIAFLMAFMASVLSGMMLDLTLAETLVFFLGSMAGVYKLRNARMRSGLLIAGFWVALVQASSFLLINPHIDYDNLINIIKPLVINGFLSSVLVMSTLKIFETLFGEMTDFTLLELSDTSHPLLKKMLIEAPGTYHHSMVVSNLAEAAADAIGAHGLLTRVGAYYHDIGKISKPHYFTENQIMVANKHDALEPSMSRLVILNHVKEGVELAQSYRLNQRIIDFIPQHHGTSLMHYFYQKAIAENPEEELNEGDYRYAGPKPQSKETALVMLADSAEGATRAMTDHSPAHIEDIVRKVINNKFIDGQLDECHLTLREINTTTLTFTRLLSAMYHQRVAYPQEPSSS